MTASAQLLPFEGRTPSVDERAWLAPSVTLTGDVRVSAEANLWFGVVGRGDLESIEIGEGSNVQDGCVLHTDDGMPLQIAAGVAIGHGAIVHGCRIESGALIGMGAIVMSGAVVGARSIIGAGAVVSERTQIPPGSVAVGVPAKVIGESGGEEGAAVCARYKDRASKYRTSGIGR